MADFMNSGIPEYHVCTALQQGWRHVYYNSFANFKGLFSNVSENVLKEWHDALRAKPLQIRVHGDKGLAEFPGVVVQWQGEQLANNPIGTVHHYGDSYVHAMLTNFSLVIEARAPNPQVARALAITVRAIMHLARQAFVQEAGLTDLLYAGMSPLSPEEEYMAELAGLAGISVVRVTYNGGAHVAIPHPVEPPESLDWFVQASDLKLDGIDGGVVAYEP